MPNRFDAICKAGNVAVITGAASGIGFATAERLAKLGMRICLADINEDKTAEAVKVLAGLCRNGSNDLLAVKTDVIQLEQLEALRDKVYQYFGQVDILMNNAGVIAKSDSWSDIEGWRRILDINLMGTINGVQAFTESMLSQNTPGFIINMGSKQGITCPPGVPGYNVSKAAVKALTETLEHSLRNHPDSQVSAHLFVPGFVYSDMVKPFLPEKPDYAWTPEETVGYFLERLRNEDFYIICPDGEVTETMDQKRILWGAMDVVENRPALSRWHPDYAVAFEQYME